MPDGHGDRGHVANTPLGVTPKSAEVGSTVSLTGSVSGRACPLSRHTDNRPEDPSVDRPGQPDLSSVGGGPRRPLRVGRPRLPKHSSRAHGLGPIGRAVVLQAFPSWHLPHLSSSMAQFRRPLLKAQPMTSTRPREGCSWPFVSNASWQLVSEQRTQQRRSKSCLQPAPRLPQTRHLDRPGVRRDIGFAEEADIKPIQEQRRIVNKACRPHLSERTPTGTSAGRLTSDWTWCHSILLHDRRGAR